MLLPPNSMCSTRNVGGEVGGMHIVKCKHFRLIFEEKAMVSFKD